MEEEHEFFKALEVDVERTENMEKNSKVRNAYALLRKCNGAAYVFY